MKRPVDLIKVDKLVMDAIEIQEEDAKKAGAIGFMARALIQATIPHKKIKENSFVRSNGGYRLAMNAHPDIGLPYGSYPRLLLCWMTTEAVRTKERELMLGPSLSSFMGTLGILPTGGRWGTIGRLKDQMQRLFSTTMSCVYGSQDQWNVKNIAMVDEANLWWDPKSPDQAALWCSKVIISEKFFEEVTSRPVPVDLRALRALKKSPLALDIYCWLTYRMSYLPEPTEIPWKFLQLQFGAGYALTPQGKSEFKREFNARLHKVLTVYPGAKVNSRKNGLGLSPSSSHVPKIRG